jgi:DNA-directed RNA polymerase specialized sigma24 family protein
VLGGSRRPLAPQITTRRPHVRRRTARQIFAFARERPVVRGERREFAWELADPRAEVELADALARADRVSMRGEDRALVELLVAGFTVGDLAREFGCSRGTVKRRIARLARYPAVSGGGRNQADTFRGSRR